MVGLGLTKPGADRRFQGAWQFLSTTQLCEPGRLHKVSDELESFFFVLFYAALHWITHNIPYNLNVGRIFDPVQVFPNGKYNGGGEKLSMYIMGDTVLRVLEFTMSPLLTELVRRLFRLFQSLALTNYYEGWKPAPEDMKNVKKLQNFGVIVKLMKDAAMNKAWTEIKDRTAIANYPRKEERVIDIIDYYWG